MCVGVNIREGVPDPSRGPAAVRGSAALPLGRRAGSAWDSEGGGARTSALRLGRGLVPSDSDQCRCADQCPAIRQAGGGGLAARVADCGALGRFKLASGRPAADCRRGYAAPRRRGPGGWAWAESRAPARRDSDPPRGGGGRIRQRGAWARAGFTAGMRRRVGGMATGGSGQRRRGREPKGRIVENGSEGERG